MSGVCLNSNTTPVQRTLSTKIGMSINASNTTDGGAASCLRDLGFTTLVRGKFAHSTTHVATPRALRVTAGNNTGTTNVRGHLNDVRMNGQTSVFLFRPQGLGSAPVRSPCTAVVCSSSRRGISAAVIGNGVICDGNRFSYNVRRHSLSSGVGVRLSGLHGRITTLWDPCVGVCGRAGTSGST